MRTQSTTHFVRVHLVINIIANIMDHVETQKSHEQTHLMPKLFL